jgi:hypothetical protein
MTPWLCPPTPCTRVLNFDPNREHDAGMMVIEWMSNSPMVMTRRNQPTAWYGAHVNPELRWAINDGPGTPVPRITLHAFLVSPASSWMDRRTNSGSMGERRWWRSGASSMEATGRLSAMVMWFSWGFWFDRMRGSSEIHIVTRNCIPTTPGRILTSSWSSRVTWECRPVLFESMWGVGRSWRTSPTWQWHTRAYHLGHHGIGPTRVPRRRLAGPKVG